MLLRSLVVACVAIVPVAAQPRTLIVDAARGAGYDFTDIQPAVTAAQNGDRILVRPGGYTFFRVDKAISILGGPGVRIVSPLAFVSVDRIARDQDVVLSGLDFTAVALLANVDVTECGGRVLIEDVHMGLRGAIKLMNCAQVVLERCSGAVSCRDSQLTMSEVEVTVGGFLEGLMVFVDSSVSASRCSAAGSAPSLGPQPAVFLDNSTLRLTDDGTHSIAAGVGSPRRMPVAAIAGTGAVVLDPRVVLVPRYGGPRIDPRIRVRSADLPSLTAFGGPLGGLATVELAAGAHEPYWLLWSDAGNTFTLPPFEGEIWLDPATAVLARTGILDSGGRTTFTFRVPRLPGLVGAPFRWQGVAGSPPELRLSNPASYTHAPQ